MSPAQLGQPIARDTVSDTDSEHELELLIREARTRQRHRRVTLGAGVTAVIGIALWIVMIPGSTRSPRTSWGGRATAAVRPNGRCPTSPATYVANPVFDATVLGRGPVRLAIGNRYEAASRRVVLGTTEAPGWSAIEAIWVTARGYNGPFLVRGIRLQRPGTIEVRPADLGRAPGSGPLSIAAGGDNTGYGLSVYPGSLWVRSGGCYALHISGRGFHESIVFDGQAPAH